MAELKCADGTIVQISAETEAELRLAFGGHKWKHGDVLKITGGAVLVCVAVGGSILVFNIAFYKGREVGSCGPRRRDFRQSDVFLFNIKDKL